MSQFVKKENMTIIIGQYEKDGKQKNQYKTVGELVTMIGDDGNQYQFWQMWGPSGVQNGKIFEPRDDNQQQGNQGQNNQQQNNQGQQQNNQQQNQQQPMQGYGSNQQNYQNQPNPQGYQGQ